MIALEGVTKSFMHHGNKIEVLKGIDLAVTSGESVAIMGASGVGKSTLLNIMGSLEQPSEGVVRFRDQDIYSMDEKEISAFRNRKIGFVFQSHHLLPEFNALENAMMPALIARLTRNEAARKAGVMLDRVGLSNRLTHRAGELSGGEQQRVAIARALVMSPELLLADEPTGNLDWFTGQEVADLLFRIMNEDKVAMVVATHNERLAEKMSRKMEIAGGKIL